MQRTRTATEKMNNLTNPLLSVRNLKTYFKLDEGIVKAVDGVEFDVYPGQVLGIVGESGCGKSVTIKSALRIVEKPGKIVDGEIWFYPQKGANSNGNPIDLVQLNARGREMRDIRGNEIALIPQEPMAAFSPVHTIGNQLIEAVRLHQKVNKRQAIDIAVKALQEVGMPNPEQRMSAYSWELSGGLRQRAMIAMALTCNPSLLIADEPTTAIDVTTQAQVLNLLRSLQERHNMSIIFITHDLGVIAQVADFVVVMYLGRVMETGTVDDIFHNPRHPYTKALLESIPTVHSPSKELLPTIEGSIPHPFNRPPGCPFYPRCEKFMPGVCNERTPSLQEVYTKQSVSCFLHHDRAEED
jgi:peptide/nickel transport system ATP-binding protein